MARIPALAQRWKFYPIRALSSTEASNRNNWACAAFAG